MQRSQIGLLKWLQNFKLRLESTDMIAGTGIKNFLTTFSVLHWFESLRKIHIYQLFANQIVLLHWLALWNGYLSFIFIIKKLKTTGNSICGLKDYTKRLLKVRDKNKGILADFIIQFN